MKAKIKLPHAEDAEPLNLTDIAGDLASEVNYYIGATEELPDMSAAELGSQLDKMLSSETIRFFLEQGDFGRGFLSGLAAGIFTLELEVDRQIATREGELDPDDELSDEDLEDLIHGGLKNGTRGGGKGEDDQNH